MKKLRNIEQVREAIRAEARIEDIARSMYNLELRQAGSDDMKGCCPFHEEKTPSFGIRKSKQLFHCFGCKAAGDVYKFVERMDNIEHMEALRKIAEHINFDLDPYKEAYTPEEKRLQELYNLNKDVVEYAKQHTDALKTWCKTRRLNFDIVHNTYDVGYTDKLHAEDIPAADLEQANALGLTETGKWGGRLTIPVKDQFGRVAGFRNKEIHGESKIKILGPHQSHPLPVPEIYGLYEARRYVRNAGFIILVEGEPDVWQMAAHGYRNVASMMGSKLSESAMATIDSLSIPLVILMADDDDAGRKLSAKVAETKYQCNTLIKIATLKGNGKDPDEILLADGPDAIGAALADAKYAFEYLIERTLEKYDITRATEKLDALTDLRPHFVSATPVVRDLAARLLARLVGLDVETVIDFFREATADAKADLHNVAAERSVLKRMLTDEAFVGDALLTLRPEDFYLSKHRTVYEAASKLYRSQQVVNEATVRTYVENRTGETSAGLFSSIMGSNINTDGADYLLTDLKDKSIRRMVQQRARDVANRLGDTSVDAKTIIQALSADISTAVSGGGNRLVEVGELVQDRMTLMHERIKNPNAIIGLDLGPDWPILNHTLHGLQSPRLVIVSAPSGIGKTAFAGALTKRIAVELRVPTLSFTFETGAEAITDRIISSISGVESDKIVTGYVTKAEAELVHEAAAQIAASPLLLTERGIVFEECVAIIRHDVLKRGTRVVVIDYLQLMTMAQADSRLRRDQELGLMSRGFLTLAKELGITIVCLAQQNRAGVKSGTNQKEDIGESYKIIQDCDIAIIFRELSKEEIEAQGGEQYGNRIMDIAKNRHGKPAFGFRVVADLGVMRMKEYAANRAPVA